MEMKNAIAAIVLGFALLGAHSVHAAVPVVASVLTEGATTAVALQGIRSLINDSIDKAQNSGDYLLFRAGTELKSVIDTWEKANANLLNITFRELNDSQRKFFADANAAAEKLNQDVNKGMEDTKQIAELLNQTIQDIHIFNGGLALFRYSPRIAYPGMGDSHSLTLRGVNFDDADPQLKLPSGALAKRVSLTKQEAVFTLPNNEFVFDPSSPRFANLQVIYLNPSNGFWGSVNDFFKGRTKKVSTDIAILQLPQNLGEFELVTKVRMVEKETFPGKREFHYSARDDQRTFNQDPHANDWLIDVETIREVREWGKAGRGCHIMSKKPHGFSVQVRVGTIRSGLNLNAPGYQHCIFQWTEYKDKTVVTTQAPVLGQIAWQKDVPLELPENKDGFLLKVRTWGGKERSIAGSQTEQFYRVVETGRSLIIQPQIPADLNGL